MNALAFENDGASEIAARAPRELGAGNGPIRPVRLARLDRSHADAMNAILRPRRAVDVGGKAVDLAFTTSAGDEEGLALALVARDGRADEHIISFRVPRRTLERILERSVGDVPDAPATTLALLVEAALADEIKAIEARLGLSLGLRIGGAPGNATWLGGEIVRSGARYDFALGLDSPALERLARLCRTLPVAEDRRAWPIAWRAEVGSVRLTIAQLASLRSGDALLPDRPISTRDARIVVAGRLAAPARVASDGRAATLLDACHVVESEARGGDTMTDDDNALNGDPVGTGEAGSLDEIELDVVFELGRGTVALGDLRGIGPGHVLALDGRGGIEAVDIVVNGRRIGTGEAVSIGERTGVRITRLFEGS